MTTRSGTSLLPTPVVHLLDESAATSTLRAAGLAIARAHPEYLRHKADQTSIVSYRFEALDGTTEGRGYAQWCAQADRAEEIHRKAMTLRPRPSPLGVSTIRVDAHTVFYGFPNDGRLRRLRWYVTPRKLTAALTPLAPAGQRFRKSLSTSTVLKYKPERRLVTKLDLAATDGSRRLLLVRYTTGNHAPFLAEIAAALVDSGVRTPQPRARLDNGRVSVDDFIEGEELRTWVRETGSVADELADGLLAFHRATPPVSTPVRSDSDILANALDGLGTLTILDRRLLATAEQVAVRLERQICQGPTALIHGDLHDKNVLVRTGEPWFIDLERAAVGSPASDLGRLRAHAISLEIRQPGWSPTARPHAERVIDRYRSQLGPRDRFDDRTLSWHCAIALVDQALLVTRHVEAGWQENARALLGSALKELDRR